MIEPWHWALFCVSVGVVLFADLFLLHPKNKAPGIRNSIFWTLVWVVIASFFGVVVFFWLGKTAAQEFFTGYVIEWSLSMDNVFVFSIIFTYFRVPREYQYRMLFWGIMGAIVMRLLFIILGKEAIDMFTWVLPLLGGVLIVSGLKLAFQSNEDLDPEKNILLRIARRVLPMSRDDHGEKLIASENSRLVFTPMFLVLLVIASTDIVFALDSIPAIFGVVDQKADRFAFIVLTSNIFAILGLRVLYFLLADLMQLFKFLHYGLSLVIIFVGAKIVIEHLAEYYPDSLTQIGIVFPEGHVISPGASLLVVLAILTATVFISLAAAKKETKIDVGG